MLRFIRVLACLTLFGLSACEPVKPKLATGAEFVDEFHTLCPRALRSADDARNAFAAAGAYKTRRVMNLFVQTHAAPAGLPGVSPLERGGVQWRYDGRHWLGIASVTETATPGGVEIRCKVQIPTGQGELVDWLMQYSSGSLPVAADLSHGARVLLFKDNNARPEVSAYYVLWRDLPAAAWGAKPSLVLQYVVRTGPAHRDPVIFQTPQTAALARLDRYCADPEPDVVAAQVSASGNGQLDPDYAADDAQFRQTRRSRTWIMRDSDEWRLHTNRSVNPVAPLDQCVVRMAGMHTASMIDALVDDPRMALFNDEVSRGQRTLEFRFLKGDRTLLYQTKAGPDEPMKSHSLTLVKGVAALREATGHN